MRDYEAWQQRLRRERIARAVAAWVIMFLAAFGTVAAVWLVIVFAFGVL